MTISHVRGCQPNSMIDYAASLRASNTTFTDQVQQMDRGVDTAMGTWQGETASAASARRLSEKLAGSHVDTAVVAIADVHASHGAILDGIRISLLVLVDQEAPGAGMAVSDDGTVTAPKVLGSDTTVTGMLLQSQLDGQAQGFETRIKSLLTQFGDGENRAAQDIRAAQHELEAVENSPGSATISPAVQAIVDGKAQLPSDPQQLHEMWVDLSPAEKDLLFDHDNYIGNRDGIPVAARDHYNRIKLGDELTRAYAGDPAVAGRLEDLEAVKDTVDKDPNRMLMLLDTQSGVQTHAAVAVGNPDTADHVAVTTPGLNTTVGGSIETMTDEGRKLRQTAEFELNRTAGHEGETVSTISWIGYDAPQLDSDDLASEKTLEGAIRVSEPWNAQAGAPNLSRFYEGVDASHDGAEPHLTAVGHSYGSLPTGLALQQTPDGVVDDTIVYGSPGLGTGHDLLDDPLDELNIEPGHAYEMSAHNDPVAHMNRFGWSPGYMSEFTHLDTDATTTPDGVQRDGATGHSEYPRTGDNGQLRTSGYNTSIVIAGLGGEENKLIEGDPAIETGSTDILTNLAGMWR